MIKIYKEKKLKYPSVTQEHGMGCGLACLAYILGLSYQKVWKIIGNPQNAWKRGYFCSELIKVLRSFRMPYKYKKIKSLEEEILKVPNTIVFIEKSSQYPMGHFLVRTAHGSWMNPWINFPKIAPAKSGFQRKLPGHPIYAIYPEH
jgi:hypothetical protein